MAIANYTRTCGKNVPGNSKILITEKDNISSITVTAGEVTAVTMGSGLVFHELQADKSSVRRKQDETFIKGVLAIVHTIEMTFKGLSKDLNTLRSAIHDALDCGIVAIVYDDNGQAWLVGWNETNEGEKALDTLEAAGDSGISVEENEMGTYKPVISCINGYLDLPFDATQNAAILDETATYCSFN